MPLARCALYAQGIEIYVAPTYDSGERWLATMQHIAREGGCWVLGSGCAFQGARHRRTRCRARRSCIPNADEWINPGDSVGRRAGRQDRRRPAARDAGILYAEIDLERVGMARRSLDVVGHYARPDLFQLRVDRRPQRRSRATARLHPFDHEE